MRVSSARCATTRIGPVAPWLEPDGPWEYLPLRVQGGLPITYPENTLLTGCREPHSQVL